MVTSITNIGHKGLLVQGKAVIHLCTHFVLSCNLETCVVLALFSSDAAILIFYWYWPTSVISDQYRLWIFVYLFFYGD